MQSFDDSAEFEDDGGEGLDLARAFSAVRRRWLWIGAFAMAIAGASSAYMLAIPNRYEATAVVQIDPRRNPVSNLEGVFSELKANTATIESEVEIIQSRGIARRVIDILSLRSDSEFSGSARTDLGLSVGKKEAVPPGAGDGTVVSTSKGAIIDARSRHLDDVTSLRGPSEPGNSRPLRDNVAAAFANRLRATRVRTTLLIEIRFEASDPRKAAKIVNTIAEVYLAEQLRGKQRATREASRLLEGRIDHLRGKVRDGESKVEAFKISHGMYAAEGQVLSEKALARLMEQTVIARNNTAQARAKFEQVKAIGQGGSVDGSVADVVSSIPLATLKGKLAEALRRRAELSARYGSRHPEMLRAMAEIADARSQLDGEARKLVIKLESEYRQARAREKELLSDLENSKGREAISKQESVRLRELERDAHISKQLLEALVARFKQTSETEGLQLPDARIVEQSDVPHVPTSPKRTRFVVVATVLSVLLGIALTLFSEFGTTGLGRPEDVEQVLELDHLSSLPLVDNLEHEGADPLMVSRQLIAEPSSGFSEAIRGVRRALDVMIPGGGSRVIMVAASLPGEGSSMVASNLAHHYALMGQRVLLVDSDVRKSKLSRQLVPQRQLGLTDVLAGRIHVEQAILRDTLTGLHFLPATGVGPVYKRGPELLSMPTMGHAIDRLRGQFDRIIIDAPPLLPVIDGRIIADYADQILFVMAWRNTPKTLAKRALKGLAVNARKIAGVVVNKVDPDLIAAASGLSGQVSIDGSTRQRFAA